LKSNNETEQQRAKQQSQYYQKMQQSELAEFLNLKEAALANKTNKLTSSASSNQIKTPQNNANIIATNATSSSGGGNKPNSLSTRSNQLTTNSNSRFKPLQISNNENSNHKNNNNNNNNNKVKIIFDYYFVEMFFY
jgi:hypothetical protein